MSETSILVPVLNWQTSQLQADGAFASLIASKSE